MLRKLLLIGISLSLWTTSATAQQSLQAKPMNDAQVRYAGTYVMSEGRLLKSPAARANATRVLYNCTYSGNYFGNVGNSFSTVANQEWIDEGEIPDENQGFLEQIVCFDFAYCSTDIDPSGNSSAMLISFYDDHAPCSTTSSALCSYIVGGLPLSTNGNLACWGVSVDLDDGFECSTNTSAFWRTAGNPSKTDSHFGWGFTANPGMTAMNNTGPILDLPCPAPVSNCASGGSLSGNANQFAWLDPSGYWTGCYWFGGVPWASFSMKMYGPGAGTIGYYQIGAQGNGAPTHNGLRLKASDYAPGQSITITVTPPQAGNTQYLIASATLGSTLLPSGNVLLVGLPFLLPPTPLSSTGTTVLAVPPSVPNPVYIQVAETSGPPTLAALTDMSNACCMYD